MRIVLWTNGKSRLNLQSWLPTELHSDINHMLVGFGQVCLTYFSDLHFSHRIGDLPTRRAAVWSVRPKYDWSVPQCEKDSQVQGAQSCFGCAHCTRVRITPSNWDRARGWRGKPFNCFCRLVVECGITLRLTDQILWLCRMECKVMAASPLPRRVKPPRHQLGYTSRTGHGPGVMKSKSPGSHS